MRRVVVCLLLVAPSVVAAPAPLAKADRNRDARADLLAMQGEWDWHLSGGSVVPVVICDGYIRWGAGAAREFVETIRLYPTMTPKGIDTTERDYGTSRGIYVLRDDVLVIRAGRPLMERPSSFDGNREGEMTYTLRRRR